MATHRSSALSFETTADAIADARFQNARVADKVFFEERSELRVSEFYLNARRVFDLAAVFVLSPVLILLSAAVAIAIKLESRGPALFRQKRVGRNGKVFEMLKFRSMRFDAESAGAKFAEADDPRVTPVGKIIRRFRLDELPQFWNVVRGDMSIVGPRPEQVFFVQHFQKIIPGYDDRHLVTPGITGWAQVHYGYCAGAQETRKKLRFDLMYIRNLGPSLDAKVIVKTIQVIFSGFGSR